MAKTPPVAIATLDPEAYKATSQALDKGPSLVTLVSTGKALLDRGLQSEDDYKSAVRMGNSAGSQAKRHEENFDPLCKGLNGLHKLATGLRAQYAAPWTKLADDLLGAARRWYLDAEEAKKRAERDLLRLSQQQQTQKVTEAQDLIDQGFVRQGREKLAEARSAGAVPVLPDAVPEVEGARVTPKYKGTCEDITAVMAEILAGRMDLVWEVRGEMRPLVVIDPVVLNSIVARLGTNLKCPGIKIERDVQIGAARL